MKKTLIAVAALVATGAFAQSTVTINGVVDAGLLLTNTQNSPAPVPAGTVGQFNKANNFAGNNTATSAINIVVVEDLGGGMKASFFVETNPDMSGAINSGATGALPGNTTGTTFGGGARFVGLSGDFGSVKIGAPNSATLDVIGMTSSYGTALGGGNSSSFSRTGSAGTAAAVGVQSRIIRAEKSMRYDSPAMSGFAFSYNLNFGNNNDVGAAVTPGVQTIGLTYSAGPLNAGYATTTVKNSGNTATAATGGMSTVSSTNAATLAAGESVTYNALAANYTFGATTVYGGWTSNKSSIANTQEGASVNVAVKYQATGALSVSGNLLKKTDALAAAANGSLIALGLDYALSKRTSAYGRYEKYDTNTVAGNLGERKAYAVGLRHTF